VTTPMPTSSQLKAHVLSALAEMGRAADNDDVADFVAKRLDLNSETRELPHDPARGKRTEFAYRLAWARTKLKAEGLIERVGNRRWRLTDVGLAASPRTSQGPGH
jgi:restriction system protein